VVRLTRRTGVATGSRPHRHRHGRCPNELTLRAVAHRLGLQDPQIWRILPKGRSDILCLVAADLQMRQAEAVATHPGLHKRTARARVEAHLARMLAFDFEPGVKKWRRACIAQGWCWTREQYAALGSWNPHCHRSSAISARRSQRFGPSTRARSMTCVMDWTQEQATMELTTRLLVIGLGHLKRGHG
jgi:hypothetical protein